MKIGRIISLAVLLWILIFVEISIFKIGLQLSQTLQIIIHLILLVPFTLLVVYLYYKNNKKAINGFLLGFLFIIIGSVLDLIITIPLFVKSFSFYNDVWLWIGMIEVIVLSGVFSYLYRK